MSAHAARGFLHLIEIYLMHYVRSQKRFDSCIGSLVRFFMLFYHLQRLLDILAISFLEPLENDRENHI